MTHRFFLPKQVHICLAALMGTLAAHAQVELDDSSNFSTGFEASEGFAPGYLQSDPVWRISGFSYPEIGSFGYGSGLGLELDEDVTLSVDFFSALTPAVGWVDFYVKPAFSDPEHLPTRFALPQAALTGFVAVDQTGTVYVLHGDGQGNGVWLSTGYTVPMTDRVATDWLRMTYRLDYSTLRWDLYLDSQLQMINLGFVDAVAPPLASFRLQGSTEGPTRFDQFSAGYINPLFADADNDGMPDSFEILAGLNPYLNDRDDDGDRDGLSNIAEFLAGTDVALADSDGDGMHDGAELADGADPLAADVYAFNPVPFLENFESHQPGPLDGQGLWTVDGGPALVQTDTVFDGTRALGFAGEGSVLELRSPFAATAESTVWVDLHLQPVRFEAATRHVWQDIAPNTAAAFYFAGSDEVLVLDGNGQGGGEWQSFTQTPAPAAADGWERVTLQLDYTSQTFSLYVNGARIASDLGFARNQPYFNRFLLKQQSTEPGYLDDLQVSLTRPSGLDVAGLIGYWPLDGDALDYSGNDYHGNLLGGASFVPNPGGQGQVLQTAMGDMGSGHVDVALPLSYHPGQDVVGFTGSGSVWVMFDDRLGDMQSADWQGILRNPPGLLYLDRNLPNNRIVSMVRSSENGHPESGNFWPQSPVGSVGEEGVWYHVAWTFHSHNSGGEGHFRWYLNGEMVANYTSGVQTRASSDFRIGSDYLGYSPNAKIAEVRLYDRILEPAEVADLYASSRVLQPPEEPQPGDFPQWWIDQYFPGQTEVDPDADPDGDGRTNWEEYLDGTDPLDYYDGVLPELTISGGDHQSVAIGEVSTFPLSVLIQRNGAALDNAPVEFTIEEPGRGILKSGMGTHFPSVEIRTSSSGQAGVYFAATGEDIGPGNVTIRARVVSDASELSRDFTITVTDPETETGPKLFAGPNQTFMITGEVVSGWGDDAFGQVSGLAHLPGDIVKIVAGSDHVTALGSSGQVYIWGDNFSGQLGVGDHAASAIPILLDLENAEAVLDIAAGDGFSALLVRLDGGAVNLYMAGDLSGGLIEGSGLHASFTLVTEFSSSSVVEVAAMGRRILARCADGSVWAWGDNRFGQTDPSQLARTVSQPVEVISGGAVSVKAAPDLSLALLGDGRLAAWGNSSFGQINAITNAVAQVEIIDPSVAIASYAPGNGFVAYATTDGTLYTAGLNDAGQLGRETEAVVAGPAVYVIGEAVAQLAAGGRHVVFLSESGAPHGFGDDGSGALSGVTAPTEPEQ